MIGSLCLIKEKTKKIYLSIRLKKIRKAASANPHNDTVILVRLDAIGDFVMSYSTFCEYRKFYHEKKIILICSSSCLQLAQAWNIADEILSIDMKKYSDDKRYRNSINHDVEGLSSEIVIQLVFHRTIEMEYITGLINSNKKIALYRENTKSRLRKGWDKVYSSLLTYDNINDFEMKKNFFLLNSILKANILPYQSVLPKTVSTYDIKESYFIVAPGGSFQAKKWENEKFSKIIDFVIEKKNMKCYLLGAADDKEDNETIYGKISYAENVVNITGKTTMLDCIEMIRNAEFVITNDTSYVHIATAVNTKSVCIAGGWHWGRFIPYDLQPTSQIYNFPFVAYHELDCFNCNFHSKACREIKKNQKCGRRFPCIEKISVPIVMSLTLEHLLNDE